MGQNLYSAELERMVLDPKAWRRSARNLIGAASGLDGRIDEFWKEARAGRSWDDGYVAVYFMLGAFALENLLKGRIVQKKRRELASSIRSTSRLPKVLRDHDLYRLACAAGLEALAAEEEILLHRLTRRAVWYGRYPVPLLGAGLHSFRPSRHRDFRILLTQHWSSDRDDIRRLVRELGETWPGVG